MIERCKCVYNFFLGITQAIQKDVEQNMGQKRWGDKKSLGRLGHFTDTMN